MNEKQVKLPGPDHPISIERNLARVVVSVAGRVIADTRSALTLREATYPPVQYIPVEDVDFSQLKRTDHVTYWPYKRRLQLLWCVRRRQEIRECGVVIRQSVSCRFADQGTCCVLSGASR